MSDPSSEQPPTQPGSELEARDAPHGEFLLYTTDDGRTRVECRFENETIWLSQKLMAELFDVEVPTINEQ